jgi:arylsulfatase A-like enzyme/uncharacterized membrane protein
MSESYDLIMAAYPSAKAAGEDFDALLRAVKDRDIHSQGLILVAQDAEGRVSVRQTGDHLGRKGVAWGGGVGVLVGLFSPALLGSIAVGAAAGGLVGRFAEHRVASGMEAGLGQKLQPGTAVVIAMVEGDDRLAAERALAGTPARSVVAMDKKGIRGLKDALAEAAQKFVPDRTVLPIPDRAFGGTQGRTLGESASDWTMLAGASAPAGAPNVLLIVIDDAGFGNAGTFGGPIVTPTMTRVREMGVAYNRFHVTALCSPTRASLLTGRNPHRVGFGTLCEWAAPYPGYTTVRPRTCAALPRILKDNGYVTGGFGKWHITPTRELGAAGPFDHWPAGWGFEHFWGFLPGASGQYDPIIVQDNTIVGVPQGAHGKQYYFPDDLTDKAMEWLHAVRAQDAYKPWFLYYATGCSHAPHQVAQEWADRYKGRFDKGWDVLREETLARQKELGVVPPGTDLSARPDAFPAWDSLSEAQKKLCARQMEVYAGFSENADWNAGRLLDAVEKMGELDDTLVFFIWGDNGASLEGTVTGSFNELTVVNGVDLDAERQLAMIEEAGGIEAMGGPQTAPHYSAAWAHAGNTPFQWGKQVASHLGGTRNPMVVAWPRTIAADPAVRSQFVHCNSLAPTILEACGIPEPRVVDGIVQEPMDGISFAYTFADAAAPERHTVQHFEMAGSRAIYRDGWWACARLDKVPWDLSRETLMRFAPRSGWDPDADRWELYDLTTDYSQAHDVAPDHADLLTELKELFWQEAARNKVLPLLGGYAVIFGDLPPLPTVTRFSFAGDVQNVLPGLVPRIMGRSYSIEAQLQVPEGGAEGVIVANADHMGGFALWVDGDGHLRHTYSFAGVETYRQAAVRDLPSGSVTVRLLVEADEPKPGSGASLTLFIGDQAAGDGRLEHTVPFMWSEYAGMDIGRDNGRVVDREYEDKAPYAFTGTVERVVFDLQPSHTEAEQELHRHHAHQAVAQGIAG